LRDTAPDFQVATVDAAHFPGPAPPLVRSLRPGVAGLDCYK
jgi:hypothetical protein